MNTINANDEGSEKYEFQSLSDGQKKMLAILPIPSAILSILGSTIIILMVLKVRKTKSWIPYQRLLLAMSAYDIVSSLTLAAGAFLNPKATSDKVWVIGNDASCSAIGFLNQISYSGIFYNGMLSYYFLLTSRFGIKNRKIEKRIEPAMHIISIGFPLITASVGLFMDFYAEPQVTIGCWVKRWPKFCGEGPNSTGEECQSSMIAWIFGAWIAVFVLMSLIVNNAIIWVFVQKKTRQTVRMRVSVYSKHSNTGSESNSQLDDSSANTDGKHSGNVSIVSSLRTFHGSVGGGRKSASASVSTAAQKEIQMELDRRLKLVGSQAFLFVGSYLVSNLWTYILRLFESRTMDYVEMQELPLRYYPLLVTQAVLLPLQGLFNMMVYIRPKYLRLRSEHPSESMWSVLHRVIFNDSTRTNDGAGGRFFGKGVRMDIQAANQNARESVSSLTITSEGPNQIATDNASVQKGGCRANKPFDTNLDAISESSEQGTSSSLRPSIRHTVDNDGTVSSTASDAGRSKREMVPTETSSKLSPEQRQKPRPRSPRTLNHAQTNRSSEFSFVMHTGWSSSFDSLPTEDRALGQSKVPPPPPHTNTGSTKIHTISEHSVPKIPHQLMHTGWSSSSLSANTAIDSASDGSRQLLRQGVGLDSVAKMSLPKRDSTSSSSASMHTGSSSSSLSMHTGWSSSVESVPVEAFNGPDLKRRQSMDIVAKKRQLLAMQNLFESDDTSIDESDFQDECESFITVSKPQKALVSSASDLKDTTSDRMKMDEEVGDDDDITMMKTGWSLDNMPIYSDGDSKVKSPTAAPDDDYSILAKTGWSMNELPLVRPSTQLSVNSGERRSSCLKMTIEEECLQDIDADTSRILPNTDSNLKDIPSEEEYSSPSTLMMMDGSLRRTSLGTSINTDGSFRRTSLGTSINTASSS